MSWLFLVPCQSLVAEFRLWFPPRNSSQAELETPGYKDLKSLTMVHFILFSGIEEMDRESTDAC